MNILEKKKQIADLIENNNESISFHKPKQNSKSSLMWDYFKIVVINYVKQDMVCCKKYKELFVYWSIDGTAILVKHNRSCDNDATNSSINLNYIPFNKRRNWPNSNIREIF